MNKRLGYLHKETVFFLVFLFLISVSYLVFEYLFISYSALAADEFVFARNIYEYTFHLPYRDFPPYKTVLGYYLLSLPMYFSKDMLATLFNIKTEIALLNILFIGMISWLAKRLFNIKAILLTWLLLMANQLFLIYSTDLRVDMLTSWVCLLAILCVMDNRHIAGGILISMAFLVSQKALWYIIALNAGMLFCWLNIRNSFYTLNRICIFNLTALLPLFIYFFVWSLVSSPRTVLYYLFYEAYVQACIDLYATIYLRCWHAVLTHGPLLFFLWPLTTIMLLEKTTPPIKRSKQLFVMSVATVSLVLFILYKQPFPYNFVFTVPAFFILYAQFIDWLLQPDMDAHADKMHWLVMIFYIAIILTLVYTLEISTIYYGIIILIVTIIGYLYCAKNHNKLQTMLLYLIAVLFFITGVFAPGLTSLRVAKCIDGNYQQTMLRLAVKLVQPGGYVSGIPYLYQKDQPIRGMKNLIEPALIYLYKPSEQVKTLLLPSLYLDVTDTKQIVADFEKTPVKLIINNYRILQLPMFLRDYIEQHYKHFYGSLYLYAPVIEEGTRTFELKFDGRYGITPEFNTCDKPILLMDGHAVSIESTINLRKGMHLSAAECTYRLVLKPDLGDEILNPQYVGDNWLYMLKSIVT